MKKPRVEVWQTLVHVCRRWRLVVFGSPRRLKLQLFCTPGTPARDILDVWPALPLMVKGNMALSTDIGNIIAALGQSNRVCEVDLQLTGWQLEEVSAQMQVPFPELTLMQLSSHDETSVIPDSFLGGSAPHLKNFMVSGISFPGLMKLLLSADHLVFLVVSDIPHSAYISPEAMVALLSALSCLRSFTLGFKSPQSRPDRKTRSLPPFKRSILPALHSFHFKGVTEYLEDLLTVIDTPQLFNLDITFFNQIDFDCPRLAQYIKCTPKLRARDEAHVQFDRSTASVRLRHRTPNSNLGDLLINISCRESDWQLSSIEQFCNSLHPLSTVEDLYIERRYSKLVWKDDAIENTLWLQLLLSFTGVKNLYLSEEFAPGIAATLQGLVGGRIAEVLPSLQNISAEALGPSGPFWENIGQFVAARQHSDHFIAISGWDKTTT